MAPRPAKKPAAGNPTPKKEKTGGAKSKQATPKAEPVPAVTVEAEDPKQSPPKPNGTKAVPDADIVMEDDVKQEAEEDSKDEKLDLDDNEPEHDVEGQEEQEDEIEEHQGDVQEGDGEDAQGEGEEAEGQDGEEDEGDSQAEEAEGVENEGQGGDGEDEEHQINDIPAPLKDRRKQKEFEIFVGGLDKEADEEDLKKVFGVVGEIKEIRMSKNPASQKNRGFAFIRYATIEEAKRALTELKDAQVKDKRCGVSPSQDNDTLYLGNICKTWTKDAVREKLNEFGIENLEEMALMDDPKNEGQNRGFAFLEFTTHQCAMEAYKRLQKRDVVLGCERTAKVAFAESSIQPDEELMAQVKAVFLDGLPASWDDERVKEELKQYGEIEKVQLSKNMSSAKRKDYGFVHFSSREEAQACVDALKISEIGEGDTKVKANIAKPQNKSRLVKQGVRGGYRIGEVKSEGGKGRKRNRRGAARNDRGRNDRNRGRGPKNDKKKEKSTALPEKQADPKRATKNDSGQKKKRDRDTGFRKSNFRDQNRSRGVSRNETRRLSYPDDRYSRHLERVHSYLDAPSRHYPGVSGSKRPYSALDDVPRYAEPALRHPRARLDYDVNAGASLYGGAAYGRLGRAPEAGYSNHSRTDLIGQQSYGLYDGHQAGSLGGAAAGGIYSPGYGTSSLPGRTDAGGSSYSSLYASRRSSGDYLLGRGSRPYY